MTHIPQKRQSLWPGSKTLLAIGGLALVLLAIALAVGFSVWNGGSNCNAHRPHGGVSSNCQ